MTNKELKKLWIEYNEKYFQGQLDESLLTLKVSTRMTTTLGNCGFRYGHITIKLSKLILDSKVELESTLLHEMIHQWQFQTTGKGNHGRSFKFKARELMNLGSAPIYTKGTVSKDAREKVRKAIDDRNSFYKQYIVESSFGINFIKNPTSKEIIKLKNQGYNVYLGSRFYPKVRNTRISQFSGRPSYHYNKSLKKVLEKEGIIYKLV